MTEPSSVTARETRGSWLLWFGILAGPLAWAVQIVVSPDLNEVLCYPGAGASRGELYGLSMQTFHIALGLLLTGVAMAGGVAAYSCLRRLRRSADPTGSGRASWMARSGVLVSVLFLLGIVVNFFPMLMLPPCRAPL